MGQSTSQTPSWWKRRITWGTITAFVLGAISVIVDQGGSLLRLGAIIVISGTLLTLAVECYLSTTEIRHEQTEQATAHQRAQEEVAHTLDYLGTLAQAPQELRDFVRQIVPEWMAIRQVNSLLLNRILENQRLEFRSRLRDLSNGKFVMDRQSFLQFRSLSLNDLLTMHGISALNPDYWRTAQGVRYLANQAQAIRSGLDLRRVLVLRQGEVSDFLDVVQQQLAAGIRLSIVIYEQVEADDLIWLDVDRFIITDKAGVRAVLSFRTGAEGHTFANDEAQILETERILENLRAYEHSPQSLYPELSG